MNLMLLKLHLKKNLMKNIPFAAFSCKQKMNKKSYKKKWKKIKKNTKIRVWAIDESSWKIYIHFHRRNTELRHRTKQKVLWQIREGNNWLNNFLYVFLSENKTYPRTLVLKVRLKINSAKIQLVWTIYEDHYPSGYWNNHGEFDPGSERTLAARLKHASRAVRLVLALILERRTGE